MTEAAGVAELRVRVRPNLVLRVPAFVVMLVCGVLFPAAEIVLVVTGVVGFTRSSVGQGVFFVIAAVVLLLPLVFLTRLCWTVVRGLSHTTYLAIGADGVALGPLRPSTEPVRWANVASVGLSGDGESARFTVYITPTPRPAASSARTTAATTARPVRWFTAPLSRLDVDPAALRAGVEHHSGGAVTLTST